MPDIADDEVLVYVMAAGINYNNVWAGLGIPVDVIEHPRTRPAPRPATGALPHRRQRRLRDRLQGRQATSPTSRSVTRSSSTAARWDRNDPWVKAGDDPMYASTFRIWGYETNWGSFAQFTRVQGHQCMPKPKHLTWEEAAAYMLVGRRPIAC